MDREVEVLNQATPTETQQLKDFYALIAMQMKGTYTVAERQHLAIIQARMEPKRA